MPFAVGPRGVRIHYEVVGSGTDNVVLVQGLGLSSRFWFEQPDLLVGDPEHPRRVLVLDNRGTGRSDKPRPPYRMSEMADDVVAAMDAAGMRRAVVVGISMGGMIAQHVALRHPNRIDGLVLLATTPGLPHGKLPGIGALVKLISLPLLTPRGGGKLLASILLTKAQIPDAKALMRDWPAALREERVPPLAFLGQLAAVVLHSTGFRLRKLDVPVIVVGAAQDVLLPAACSKKLAALIPHAELELLADAAHGIPIAEYANDLTLAQIGKLLGEHEATVSRKLDRTRNDLRRQVEKVLRDEKKLSDAQLRLCFDYAREEWPFDLTGALSARE